MKLDLNTAWIKTRTVTMDGNKMHVPTASNAYDVVISAPSGKTVKCFETQSTYVEDGVTYGTGYEASHQLFPAYKDGFYLQGTAGDVVQLVFICGRK